MKVIIKDKYLRTFIPKRCRKERQESVDITFPVTISESTPEDTPIAFIVREYGEFPSIVRLYRGKLYRSHFDYTCSYPNNDRTLHHIIPLDKTPWGRYLAAFPDTYGMPSLGKEETIAKARRKAKDYLIVEGELYQRCGEPYYHAVTFGLGRNHGGTGFFVRYLPSKGHVRNGNLYPSSCPANEREDAIRTALLIAYRRGDDQSYDHLLRGGNGDIEVLIPEACKYAFPREYNKTYPMTEDERKAVDAIGQIAKYDGSVSDVLDLATYPHPELLAR